MANTKLCPQCSGKLVPIGERTGGFSGGKAVVGAVVAGPIGVAAGALGKKLITMQCEKCGYTVETTEKDAEAAEQYGNVHAPIAELQHDLVNKQIQFERQQRADVKNKDKIGNLTPEELEVMRERAWSDYQQWVESIPSTINKYPVMCENTMSIIACIGNAPVTFEDIREMIPSLDSEENTSWKFEQFMKIFGGTIRTVQVVKPVTNQHGLDTEKTFTAYRFADQLPPENAEIVLTTEEADEVHADYEKALKMGEAAKTYEDFENVKAAFDEVCKKAGDYKCANYLSELFQNLLNERVYRTMPSNSTALMLDTLKQLEEQLIEILDDSLTEEGVYTDMPMAKRIERWRTLADETERQREAEHRAEQSRQWESQGLCRYCGGEIGGLFGKKCKSCGQKA